MTARHTGGCACGAIRFVASAEPLAVLNCHCRDCQRASGTAHATAAVFPVAALAVEGAPRSHEVRAESGNTTRREFCPTCGSPLFAGTAGERVFTAVMVACFDDPSAFRPMLDIWTGSAMPWAHLDPATPKFPKNRVRPG